jgi:hypothetical protein
MACYVDICTSVYKESEGFIPNYFRVMFYNTHESVVCGTYLLVRDITAVNGRCDFFCFKFQSFSQ